MKGPQDVIYLIKEIEKLMMRFEESLQSKDVDSVPLNHLEILNVEKLRLKNVEIIRQNWTIEIEEMSVEPHLNVVIFLRPKKIVEVNRLSNLVLDQ
jgi:hypothetical protein